MKRMIDNTNNRILVNMAINNTEQEEMDMVRMMPAMFEEMVKQRYKLYKKIHEEAMKE